ncbi:hypothetical protein OG594_38895 [Streptomyces sp. NBC_01214]|uniref:hypothetical protein n=1 Tax=Streptomyces sp. NBC_01214 TaxID=2903777 RepID=UPI002257E2E9|nr:hypothetical protein [Streptomyces sp. NBC_01214]MCX4807516.1 hypothetical protein [Streptomyces sp. NBC_01214]
MGNISVPATTGRIADAGAQLKGHQGGGCGQEREGQTGGHAGADQPGGGEPGCQEQAQVGGAASAHLEIHADGSDESGSLVLRL